MNCTTCGYALWNLRTRQCPECGRPFAPSEFEFVTGAVAFCCPHCDQAYYGTDDRGHLSPKEFHCVQCAHPVSMEEMVMRPADGIHERETSPTSVPWLDPNRGRFRGFVGTISQALFKPLQLGAGLRDNSSVSQAWAFAFLVIIAQVTLMAAPLLVIVAFAVVMTGGVAGYVALFMLLALAFGAIASLLALAIWGALTHALLRMTGETTYTIGRTYESLCYSTGANVASAIPCLGWYFGWVWWVVSAVMIVKEGHRITAGRAAFAVVTPPGLLILAYFALVGTTLVMAPPPAPPAVAFAAQQPIQSAQPQTATSNLTAVLIRYADAPDHATQLIPDGHASPSMFIVDSTATRTIDVPLGPRGPGGALLVDMELMPVGEQYDLVRSAAEFLPENVVAHRVGDFVFTYHGIDLRAADRRLWLVIGAPDPDSNSEDSFRIGFVIGLASGRTQLIETENFDAALEGQNRIRAERGLAPLPHPREVMHDRPAVEGSPPVG